MNELIQECLWGGGSDPGGSELYCAAKAFIVLDELDLRIKDRKEVERCLRGENVYDSDYIEEQL